MKVFMTGCFLFPNKQNKTKLVSLVGIVLVIQIFESVYGLIYTACVHMTTIFFSP